jgi:DNA-directed RNA polymerase subunit RPC12/RpoP
MHVDCKSCGSSILVAGRPQGSTGASGVRLEGKVRLGDGGIGFGPGGKLSFGPGGRVSFGPPRTSEFTCTECGHVGQYLPEEILDE